MDAYLQATDVINWTHPNVLALAKHLISDHQTPAEIAKICFEWVRDEIRHSVDYRLNPVTWRASDVLRHKTGYCYAKSHLLAALLRANEVPVGFCYQRLSMNDTGPPYCLHGLNAVYLPEFGWYRIDARGNKADVNAQFTPPQEQLAFKIQCSEEADFSAVLPEPLDWVVTALQSHSTWDDMARNLPDVSPQQARHLGMEEQ